MSITKRYLACFAMIFDHVSLIPSIGPSEGGSGQHRRHLAIVVWSREFADTNTAESGITLEQRNEPVHVVLIGNRVQNEIESSLVP
jgi:hypothetical protein